MSGFKMLTTPDGLTPAHERLFESMKARCQVLDARLAAVIELCDEILDRDEPVVYEHYIEDLKGAAEGEES